jgi:hypothetical protein
MIPLSISATALETAEDCLAKFQAHSILRGDGFQNDAALLGTALHSALEMFVTDKIVWDEMLLCTMFRAAFMKHFSVIDIDDNFWYKDGIAILKNWFGRRDQLEDIKAGVIVDKEVKLNFLVPYMVNNTLKQDVPLNYIIDRLDKLSETTYRVVDYKSQRSPIKAEDMRKKLQVRIYSLATRIRFPAATSIQVQFDFLRYNSVTVTLTKADDANTWRYVRHLLQKIIDTPAMDVPETLGSGCQYCIRKLTCGKIKANINAGGIFSLDIDALMKLKSELEGYSTGLSGAIADIDKRLLDYAHAEDTDVFTSEEFEVEITRSRRQYVNGEKLSDIVPAHILGEYGHVNVGDIKSLKADERLSDSQRSLLSTTLYYKTGDEKVKVKPRKEGLE